MNGNHTKYMLLAGGGLLGALLVFGVPLQSALLFAVVLSCPLMMVFMMAGGHGGHDHGEKLDRRGGADNDTDPSYGHRHD